MNEHDSRLSESFVARYDLSADEVQASTLKLINETSEHLEGRPTIVAVETDASSEFSNIARSIEREVFEERFGNDAAEMTQEYGPYEKASKFYVVLDQQKQTAVAALRIIVNSEAGLKTTNDAAAEPFFVTVPDILEEYGLQNLDSVWDVGTVAVLPEYRSGQASIVAYGAMLNDAKYNNIDHLVSVVDKSVLTGLRERLGIPFVPLCDAKPGPYLGSEESHLVYGYVPDFADRISARMHEIARTPIGKRIAPAVLSLLSKSGSDAFIFNQRP